MTLANKIQVMPGDTGTLLVATGTTLNLTGAVQVNFDGGAASKLVVGSATDTGTVVWTAGTGISGPITFEIAGGTVQAGGAQLGGLTGTSQVTTRVDSGGSSISTATTRASRTCRAAARSKPAAARRRTSP